MSSEATETAATSETYISSSTISSSTTTNSNPFVYTNDTGIGRKFLGQPLFHIAITVFIFILIVIVLYLLYLHFCAARRRFRPRFFQHKDSHPLRPTDEMVGSFFGGQSPPIPLVSKELNLQPAANDVMSIHEEFRSIIASKLKKPPSTLETLIEPTNKAAPIDVEIKQEPDNDDVFSVISAKSLERYRSAGKYKVDKGKADKMKKETFEKDSDTTESENVDKVVVLKSGQSNLEASLKGLTNRLDSFRSKSKLGRRSKSRKSKTAIKKIG